MIQTALISRNPRHIEENISRGFFEKEKKNPRNFVSYPHPGPALRKHICGTTVGKTPNSPPAVSISKGICGTVGKAADSPPAVLSTAANASGPTAMGSGGINPVLPTAANARGPTAMGSGGMVNYIRLCC
jgi:hypothetical protein